MCVFEYKKEVARQTHVYVTVDDESDKGIAPVVRIKSVGALHPSFFFIPLLARLSYSLFHYRQFKRTEIRATKQTLL